MDKVILENGLHQFGSDHYRVDAFDSSFYSVFGDIDDGFFEGGKDKILELIDLLTNAVSQMEGRCGCGIGVNPSEKHDGKATT